MNQKNVWQHPNNKGNKNTYIKKPQKNTNKIGENEIEKQKQNTKKNIPNTKKLDKNTYKHTPQNHLHKISN